MHKPRAFFKYFTESMYLFITDIFYAHNFSIKLVKFFKMHDYKNNDCLENLLYCSNSEQKYGMYLTKIFY